MDSAGKEEQGLIGTAVDAQANQQRRIVPVHLGSKHLIEPCENVSSSSRLGRISGATTKDSESDFLRGYRGFVIETCLFAGQIPKKDALHLFLLLRSWGLELSSATLPQPAVLRIASFIIVPPPPTPTVLMRQTHVRNRLLKSFFSASPSPSMGELPHLWPCGASSVISESIDGTSAHWSIREER